MNGQRGNHMSPNLKRDRTGERARQAERKMAAYLKRMADRLAVFEAQAAAVYPFDDAAIGAAAEKEAAVRVARAILARWPEPIEDDHEPPPIGVIPFRPSQSAGRESAHFRLT